MKDTEADKSLMQHLSGEPPRQAFKQQALRDSTAEFMRVWRRRSVWRRARIVAAAVVIAGVAFVGGQLSAPSESPKTTHVVTNVDADPGGVNVPSELLAWLEAARLFGRLGMEDRMARAVERAGRFLPADTFIADGRTSPVFTAAAIDKQTELVEPTDIPGPIPSAETINQILAQSFGD
jgi:hypothetical protein